MAGIEIKNFNFPGIDSNVKSSLGLAVETISQSIKEDVPSYKIFSIDDAKDQIKAADSLAQDIKTRFDDIIVIGMGGAILNPRLLVSFLESQRQSSIRIHFLDNTDPLFLQNLISKLSLQKTAILAISNSGNTMETVSLVGTMIGEFHKVGLLNLDQRFYFITNTQSGILKNVADSIGAAVIPHRPGISGRYSGLTNVTSFIAQIAGIDIYEYLEGAELVLEDFLKHGAQSQPALSAGNIYSTKKSIAVNIGYLQNFAVFLEWYSQIIAESLGKNGEGITPVRGLGPNDQHSMLQLYLEGNQDKVYSLFYVKNIQSDLSVPKDICFDYMADKNLSDINEANFSATIKALSSTKLPTRSLILKDVSAKNMGSLVAHCMFEVIILGHMMKINPFDQPGVEKIKQAAVANLF